MHDGRSPVRIGILGAARIAPKRFPSRPTYAYQLGAFAAVLRGEPVKTTPKDAVDNMTVIDAIYRAAGILVREPV
jgi:predicted dehydrogenase